MSLAGTDRADHPVVRRAVRFLIDSVRDDGSWPIDTNLATWNTTLAVNALAAASGDVGALGCLDWLLACQHRRLHPFTHAAPGGWGWTDLSGAVPDADDTSGALLALKTLRDCNARAEHGPIASAAAAGVRWLLDLQNADGGWPTFCRGWGTMPFDRSGADLTAHALRALSAWRRVAPTRIERAVRRGLRFLARCQRGDGSWLPLWFGNQDDPQEENPVYGTSRVLAAYRELNLLGTPQARRGVAWLAAAQHADGGFGAATGGERSVEETALAVEALAAVGEADVQVVADKGLSWLVQAVEAGRHTAASPIGFYFARLWYYEDLYPIVFTVGAFGHALAVQTADTPCPPAIAPTPST